MKALSVFSNRSAALAVFSVLSVSLFVLSGCGGSGGVTASGNSGDTVRITVGQGSSMPGAPAGAAVPFADNIDHAWITVERVALVPGGAQSPDPLGEQAVPDDGAIGPGLVSGDVVPPTEIDLLNLPAGGLTQFLNDIPNIPAGSYGKIRLYYTDPKVHFVDAPDNAAVKPTAHAHIDIHFVGGSLVIPVRTAPAGGVFIHNVTIRFVLGKDGLKITVNPDKILMRPQVFAEISAVQFGISGIAENVAPGSFDVRTADNVAFRAVYDDRTDWLFKDGRRWLFVGSARGIAALRNTAVVDVLGDILPGRVIAAADILITFPFAGTGIVLSGSPSDGWKADNTFDLAMTADNVVVVPRPSRAGTLYEGGTDNAIVQGASVRARGYRAGDVVDAFWITIGP